MLYDKLDENSHQIRLLHILKDERQDRNGILCCYLNTVSLLDVTPSFAAFSPGHLRDDKPRDTLAEWIKFVKPSTLLEKQNPRRVPCRSLCRFQWGDFATLSYTWGDPNTTEKIMLNGKEVKVRKNLADALRVYRRLNWFQYSHYGLWVDAVCINQADAAEQGSQVARMRAIFAGSWTTVAFLGEATKTSHMAMELLRTLADLWATSYEVPPHILYELQMDPGALGPGKWLALHDFLQRNYWSRLWIVQEAVLAPDNMPMFLGDEFITWRQVRDGLSAIHVHFWYVKDACFAYDRNLLQDTEGVPEFWDSETLHHIDKDLNRIVLKENLGENRMCMAELLDVASATSCFYPVDKVYGLLGVMPPFIAQKIVVDYKIPEARLCESVARLFIRHEGLNILRSGTLWNGIRTASWAPDWTSKTAKRGLLSPHLPYEADKGTESVLTFSPDGRFLTARGVILDKIDGLGDTRSLDAEPPGLSQVKLSRKRQLYQPLRSAANTYESASAIRLALYRTLVGSRSGRFGEEALGQELTIERYPAYLLELPECFSEAKATFEERATMELEWVQLMTQGHLYKQWTQWRERNNELLIPVNAAGLKVRLDCMVGSGKLPPDKQSGEAFNEFYRFTHMLVGRRFAITEQGRFCWVPENSGKNYREGEHSHVSNTENDQVKRGDLFVLVFGCRVPLVVRPFEDKFQILGEGYLDGLMDGEALEKIKNGSLICQDFTFS